MLLYRTRQGAVAAEGGRYYSVADSWNELVNDAGLFNRLERHIAQTKPDQALATAAASPLAPLTDQEIWAAGVTYFRSRTARMEESQSAGGGDFYDRVYSATRPELFLKATPCRVVGPGEAMHLRRDARWIVPEPELTLCVTSGGAIVGYTIGNDLSCRDIEGENPLYLPQAKTFARCASVGPAILASPVRPSAETGIALRIVRNGKEAHSDRITLAQLKRPLENLVEHLFRDNVHPHGCLLMTGTGIVPPDDFSLVSGDIVEITIDGIGTLSNPME